MDNAKRIDWRELNGKNGKFYGAHNEYFKIGSIVLRAVEDENDGYRSSLSHIEIVEEYDELSFTANPLSEIVIQTNRDFLYICDKDTNKNGERYLWLRVGTDESDSYYPFFVFEYTPKDSSTKYGVSIEDITSRLND